jgi:hypothetical protein
MISKKNREPPVLDSSKTKKSIYDSIIILIMGFNVDAAYKVDTVAPKSKKNRI